MILIAEIVRLGRKKVDLRADKMFYRCEKLQFDLYKYKSINQNFVYQTSRNNVHAKIFVRFSR